MAIPIIKIEGSLDIRRCAELKEQIMGQLNQGPSVRMDLAGVSTADTAGLQLLSSLQRHANEEDIELEWAHVGSLIREKAEELGMTQERFLKSNTDAQTE